VTSARIRLGRAATGRPPARRIAALVPAVILLLSGCSGLPSSTGGASTSTSTSAPGAASASTAPASTALPSSGTPNSPASGAPVGSGGCQNLTADASVRAQVTAAHQRFTNLRHIEPVAGDFYYGRCGATSYAATDFEPAVGAGYAENVGLQDDGSTMQYYARTGSGPWRHLTNDSLPRDPRGCAAVAALPAALSLLWHGCPLRGTDVLARTYLAATGWNAHDPVYRPASVVLSGDSTLGLQDMHWSAWDADHAAGTGVGWADDCSTSCATGTIRREPIRVSLSGSDYTCGREYFTKIVLTWTAIVPPGFARSATWKSGTPAC